VCELALLHHARFLFGYSLSSYAIVDVPSSEKFR